MVDWNNFQKNWTDVSCSPSILEEKVNFICEISQISSRDTYGNIQHYPLIENYHKDGILRTSTCPIKFATDQDKFSKISQDYTSKILNTFKYVGVLALEIFVLKDGGLVANEIAPRVHNSAHLTNEAFDIGQFEMHIRCVCGNRSKEPLFKNKATMHNLINKIKKDDYTLTNNPNIKLYDYVKEFRAKRKVGHWVEYLDN